MPHKLTPMSEFKSLMLKDYIQYAPVAQPSTTAPQLLMDNLHKMSMSSPCQMTEYHYDITSFNVWLKFQCVHGGQAEHVINVMAITDENAADMAASILATLSKQCEGAHFGNGGYISSFGPGQPLSTDYSNPPGWQSEPIYYVGSPTPEYYMLPSGQYVGASVGGFVPYQTPSVHPLSELMKIIPALQDAQMPCPACNTWTKSALSNTIIHLNDNHSWKREKIADWLETLPIDLSVKPIDKETPSGDNGISSEAFKAIQEYAKFGVGNGLTPLDAIKSLNIGNTN